MFSALRKSYSDALRHFARALRLIEVAEVSSEWRTYSIDSIREALTGLLILGNVGLTSHMDLTNLAALALDKGLLNLDDFSRIAYLNVRLRTGSTVSFKDAKLIVDKIIKISSSKDPYLSRQLRLFRY
ncbi:MAG: hypothetical protein B6U73_02040 [Desulfurococcales archaeon ex4484_204]|nr:MAG: hypothetical protein B6U73_02040 [Desulfurococcales archaeon ex4484_204]